MSSAARPQKPWTGNPFAGRFLISRETYERTMRALGKEPKLWPK